MKFVLSVIVLVCLMTYGSSSIGAVVSDIDFLRSLRGRNPVDDAHQAIKREKILFLAVGGYGSHVPGIDTENCLVDRALVEIIQGTGDEWTTVEQQELQKVAYEYAFRFNTEIRMEFENREINGTCYLHNK